MLFVDIILCLVWCRAYLVCSYQTTIPLGLVRWAPFGGEPTFSSGWYRHNVWRNTAITYFWHSDTIVLTHLKLLQWPTSQYHWCSWLDRLTWWLHWFYHSFVVTCDDSLFHWWPPVPLMIFLMWWNLSFLCDSGDTVFRVQRLNSPSYTNTVLFRYIR